MTANVTATGGRIEQALTLIDEWIASDVVAGAGTAVWHGGEIVAERYAGEAQPGRPVSRQTIFGLASVTKPVTAAVVLALAETGELALDEPVYRFVAEFGPASDAPSANPDFEAKRREITIRQLLSHTSGLPEDLAPGSLRYKDGNSLSVMVDALVRLPLRTAPGQEHLYSNAGFATLGRVVERATGRDFWDVARERVLDPLGMENTFARPGADLAPRIATVADTHHPGTEVETYNSPYWRGLGMPWGGLYGTPRDLVRFAGSFLPGGPRLLSQATIDLMTSDHVHGLPGGVQSMRLTWNPAWWGLGWEVKGGKTRHWTGELTSSRTFCHFGAAGTLLWADPVRDVALAVFANRMTAHLWPFVPALRWSRLSNAVIAALS
jgi:CubicO group peptidase (beta-lactamase class C family)